MFKDGSLWRPPVMNPYTQGMPQELINDDKVTLEVVEEVIKPHEPKRGQLSERWVHVRWQGVVNER